MGRSISKEDDLAKISTSIFITNFPEACSTKELFIACKQYGHVVDSFIPAKRSKAGKRFGFVRFINVFNEERLVNNLCTVWIDRCKLQANIARFHRPPVRKNVGTTNSNLHRNDGANSKSFASTLKSHAPVHTKSDPPSPAIVLDDDCLKESDLSCSLEDNTDHPKQPSFNAPDPSLQDPFRIYKILNKNHVENSPSNGDPKFPPGFTPDVVSKQ
nr:nucleotide-binding alpha-beta plait domain-containing protein [Tanacetum cinerariifolium]